MKQIFSIKYMFLSGFIWLLFSGGLKCQAFSSYIEPGHEYLTKIALEELKQGKNKDKLTSFFYGDYVGGVTYLSHPLAYGNTINDFPKLDLGLSTILVEILLKEEWIKLSVKEQEYTMRRFIDHDDNRSQVMHFTRNYFQINKQEALSAKESCILSQNFIKDTVIYSAELMVEKHKIAKDLDQYHRKNLDLKLIGAALHTIQDSFAPAHTKRDPDSLLLEDICSFRNPYFGRNGPFKYSVNCVHTIFPSQRNFGGGSVLKDDQIWDRTQTSCQIQKDGRISKNFDCLTDYAQLATIVSGDFLESLVPFLNQSLQKRNVAYQDLEIVLDIFLNDYYPHKAKTLSLQGIMSCDGLAEFTPHTLFENY